MAPCDSIVPRSRHEHMTKLHSLLSISNKSHRHRLEERRNRRMVDSVVTSRVLKVHKQPSQQAKDVTASKTGERIRSHILALLSVLSITIVHELRRSPVLRYKGVEIVFVWAVWTVSVLQMLYHGRPCSELAVTGPAFDIVIIFVLGFVL